jgi:hypothetical protein
MRNGARELYYLSLEPRRMMAAKPTPDSGFPVANRTILFALSPTFDIDQFHTAFGLTPDGRSFVFLATSTNSRNTAVSRLVLVENWFTELRERLKGSR